MRLARHRHGLKLSTSLKMAMTETTILYLALKSIKCLKSRDRNETFGLTTDSPESPAVL